MSSFKSMKKTWKTWKNLKKTSGNPVSSITNKMFFLYAFFILYISLL